MFIIKDWADNNITLVMPDNTIVSTFDSFEDAEDSLSEWLDVHGNYDEDRQEYYIEEQ